MGNVLRAAGHQESRAGFQTWLAALGEKNKPKPPKPPPQTLLQLLSQLFSFQLQRKF